MGFRYPRGPLPGGCDPDKLQITPVLNVYILMFTFRYSMCIISQSSVYSHCCSSIYIYQYPVIFSPLDITSSDYRPLYCPALPVMFCPLNGTSDERLKLYCPALPTRDIPSARCHQLRAPEIMLSRSTPIVKFRTARWHELSASAVMLSRSTRNVSFPHWHSR